MNVTEFLDRVRLDAQIASTDEDYTDPQILIIADNELRERFSQAVANPRLGYWLHRGQFTTQANIARYRLPPRSVVQGLETIEVSTDGNAGNTWASLNLLTIFQAIEYAQTGTGSRPQFFTIESDTVRLFPTPNGAVNVRYSYYIRPAQLVAAASSAVVSATLTTITTSAPFLGQGSAGVLDVIHTDGTNEIAAVSVPYTGAGTSLTVSLTAQQVALIAVPDRVTLAGTTDYLPLPLELHAALAARTSAAILAEKGDADKAKIFAGKAESSIERFIDVASPRVKSRPFTFKSRNSYIRTRGGFGWR